MVAVNVVQQNGLADKRAERIGDGRGRLRRGDGVPWWYTKETSSCARARVCVWLPLLYVQVYRHILQGVVVRHCWRPMERAHHPPLQQRKLVQLPRLYHVRHGNSFIGLHLNGSGLLSHAH